MAKSSNQKLKILYIMKLFLEETDDRHYITMQDILDYLAANDINAERKSIYDDIELLKLYGLDIEKIQEKRNFFYYLASRKFEEAELKLLVDSVQASKFITEKKSRELIGKLESLLSRYDAVKLQRHVYVASRTKTMNENIYYNVDAINDAINRDVMIDFGYYEWNTRKKFVKRPNGDKRDISPWLLMWDDENYYLIGYDGADKGIKHYRVDKMRDITLTDNRRLGKMAYSRINPASYSKNVFGMYGGEEESVTLEFNNSLAGVVIDRFGKDIMIIPKDKDTFTIHVNVQVSNIFLSWIIGLGDGVRVVEPESVRKRLLEIGWNICKKYESGMEDGQC